jgi:hypothetical protein
MSEDHELPLIDTLHIDVAASPEGCWVALTTGVGSDMAGAPPRIMAALLGCDDRVAEGLAEVAASTFPGFHVARSERPWLWHLRGTHRFADYALVFRIADLGKGRSRVEAESRAGFPGWHGSLYRMLVVGSSGHRRAVQRMLRAVKGRAERATSVTASWESDHSPTSATAPIPGWSPTADSG